jgi:predicted RNA-binding Zn ribbon-like protein
MEDENGFRFRGGRLCLDFAATLGGRYRRPVERLSEPADLERWLREAIPITEDHGYFVTPETLGHAVDLREAIYRLVHPASRDDPGIADVTLLNEWAAERSFVPTLHPDGRGVSRLATHPARAGLATVAVDTIDLLSGPWVERVSECARPDCSLLFVDVSRPGKRRWCDMQACGNRAKADRYRSAH